MRLGHEEWTLDHLVQAAAGKLQVDASSPALQARLELGASALRRRWDETGVIYGVTTGYGDSCSVGIPAYLVAELPGQLVSFHGCGLGEPFSREETRAILAARLASVSRGWSAVRPELVNLLAELINRDILPRIPREGSVGASGDLTPLSYVAAVLCARRQVWTADGSGFEPASDALARAGLSPLVLQPKEGLALMNGTSVMTALAALALRRAEAICGATCAATALAIEAIRGNPGHHSERLMSAKPHPGLARAAGAIRAHLGSALVCGENRLQDRYSLRCAPHVVGVLLDALPHLESMLVIELNSANDNPLIDPDDGQLLHGGHFYGGHVAYVADSLKSQLAGIADLLDRQMALLTDRHASHGLPANLSGAEGERAPINHGLKAVSIATTAWCAEAARLTLPASILSRSTECHNQDKVSMGTIAARDALRIAELCSQNAAACLLASAQGVEIRQRRGQLAPCALSDRGQKAFAAVRRHAAFLGEDRELEDELRSLSSAVLAGEWPLEPQ